MRVRRLSLILLVATLAAVAFATFAGPSGATPLSAKKQRAETIRRQVAVLDTRLEQIVERYNEANGRLQSLRAQIAQNSRLLEIARYNLMIAESNLTDRVVALYKQQPADLLDVVLSTSSFDELTTELDLMQKLGQHDVDIINAVKLYKRQITQRREQLLADRAAAAELLKQVTQKKKTIEKTLSQRRTMLRGVEAEIRRIEAAEAAAARALVERNRLLNGGFHQRPIIPDAGGPGHPEVCAIAARYLGIPYQYGGASPATGFDCSGFVMYVYAQIGISLPHYSGAQQQLGTPVSMNALLPGDLVFRGYPAYHVGIYVGSGMVIHSPHTGTVVSYQTVSGWDNAVRL